MIRTTALLLLVLALAAAPASAKDVLDAPGPEPVPVPELGAGAPPPPVEHPPMEKPNPWHLGPPTQCFGFSFLDKVDKGRAAVGEEGLLTIYGAEAPEPWDEFDSYVLEGEQPKGIIVRITGQGNTGSERDCAERLKNLQAKVEELHGPATVYPSGKRLLWSWDSTTVEAVCSGGVVRLVCTDVWRLELHREYMSRQGGGQ